MTNPALAYDRGDEGRFYRHPLTGEEWPSITNCEGVLDKPALPGWAAREAAEYAVKNWNELAAMPPGERIHRIKTTHERLMKTAQDLGTEVHDAVDALCTGRSIFPWSPAVAPFMTQFDEFLAARKPEFLRNEVTVANRTEGYCGTFDWLAVIGGRVTLGDTKTGKNVWGEVALQLTALARAEFILNPDGTEEPMPAVELMGVLHLRPRSWALVPVECEEATWQAFRAAIRLRAWNWDTKPGVLGARLKAPVPSW